MLIISFLCQQQYVLIAVLLVCNRVTINDHVVYNELAMFLCIAVDS